MAGAGDEQLRLEVVGLAEQLAMEVLNTRPHDVRDIYSTCADFLARKIEDREASQRVVKAAAAWTEEKLIMKQRQEVLEVGNTDETTSSWNPHLVRPKSAPDHPFSAHEFESDDETGTKDKRLSRRHTSHSNFHYNSPTKTTSLGPTPNSSQHTLIEVPSGDEEVDNDSGFNTSECLCESRAKCETIGSSIPSPTSSLLSTSIGEAVVSEDDPAPSTGSALSEEVIEQKNKEEQTPDVVEEDDFCTFAFFKSTTERHQDTTEEPDGQNERQSSLRSQRMHFSEHRSHVVSLIGHESAITQCRVAQDFIATSSRDGTLRIWSLSTGKPLRTLNCKRPIHDFQLVYFRMKLPFLVVCCEDGGIVLVKVTEDKEMGQVRLSLGGEYMGHLPNPIRCMAISMSRLDLATGCCFMMNQISKKGKASLDCRGTLKTWNLDCMLQAAQDGKPYDGMPIKVRTMRQIISRGPSWRKSAHAFSGEEPTMYGLRALTFSPDGALLVVGFGRPDSEGSQDRFMFGILCAKTLSTLWMEEGFLCQVTRLEFLPTLRKRLYPGDEFPLLLSTFNSVSALAIRKAEDDLQVEYTWVKKFDQPHFCSMTSPNGKMIATCLGMDLQVCACATGNELLRIENAHNDWLGSVSFSPDSSRIVTVAADGSAKVWLAPDTEHLLPIVIDQKPRKRPCSASGNGQGRSDGPSMPMPS